MSYRAGRWALDQAPLSALRLAEVLGECGLPPHGLNVVCGRPAAPLVQALVSDPRVELVSFTGSVAVGRAIARVMAANGAELVRYVPELGGNAALAVLVDADLDQAARVALGDIRQCRPALYRDQPHPDTGTRRRRVRGPPDGAHRGAALW